MRDWQRIFVALVLAFLLAGVPQAQANPIQAPLDEIKSVHQKIAEITQLFSELDVYLGKLLQHVQEATLSEEDTALEELQAAARINDLFVRQLALGELEVWIEELRDELEDLAHTIKRLRSQGEFNAFGLGRVLTRSVAKAIALQALGFEIEDELQTLTAKVDAEDATCFDEFGEPDLFGSISACIAQAIAALLDGNTWDLDASAERVETIILERIAPEKNLILRKLNQMKTELKSLERELKRLARFKERRSLGRTFPRTVEISARPVRLAAGVTVKDALDRILDLRQIATDLQVQLLNIDDQMDALLDLLAELKSDIELGRPVLELRSLVEQALQLKDFTLLIELERVQANLDALVEEHASLKEQVRLLCGAGLVRRRGACRRVLQELTAMEKKLQRIPPIVDSIVFKFDNGRPPEGFPCITADPCDDVNDWLLDLQLELALLPGATTEYEAERWASNVLNAALLVQEAIEQKDCLLLGLTCAVESGLRPFRGLLRELLQELKLLQRLLGRELRAFSAVPAGPLLASPEALQSPSLWTQMIVYGLDGRAWLEVRPVAGRTPLEALKAQWSALPNGVYLVVLTTLSADGRLQKTVHKLGVLR